MAHIASFVVSLQMNYCGLTKYMSWVIHNMYIIAWQRSPGDRFRKVHMKLEEMLIYWIKHWAFQYSYTQNSDTSFVKHKRIFVSSFSISLSATWRWYIVISHGCHSANQDAAFRSCDCRIT